MVAPALAAASLMLLGPAPASRAASPPAAEVNGWIRVTLDEIVARRLNPPRASRALALVSVAMERASGKGVRPIHGAAPAILGELFPDRAAVFDARGRGLARSESQFARGRELALPVIERARTDGSDRTGAPPPLRGPGFWEPTPPAFAPALEPFAGSWRPWNVASVAALRPPPPPEPGSRQFTDELLEVYDVSRNLTEEQRRIASFWADGAGTVTPPGHWNMIALALVEEERLPALQAARALATLNTRRRTPSSRPGRRSSPTPGSVPSRPSAPPSTPTGCR